MGKYSIFATKQDYQKAYSTLEELESQLGLNLDWKKIKRIGLDELETIISIYKRKLANKSEL
jgi:hypothetical protein